MKCPSCDHEAPVSAFGDPLRCPDCGAFYERAIELRALHGSGTSRSEEPASPGSTSKKTAQGDLTQCRKCKVLIHKKATICPFCRTKRARTIGTFPGLVIIGFVIWFVVRLFGDSSGGAVSVAPAQKAASKCENPTMAFVMSQNFVKRGLKSPSTAEFPYLSEEGVSSNRVAACTYQIIAYVDSQNSFGATIRSRYSVTMTSSNDGRSWSAKGLSIK